MKNVACHQPLSFSNQTLGSIGIEQLSCEDKKLEEIYPIPSDIVWHGIRL